MGIRENSFTEKQKSGEGTTSHYGRNRSSYYSSSLFMTVALAALVMILGLTACGDEAPLESSSLDGFGNSSLHDYFPVSSGYQITFSVQDAQGQELRVEQYSASGATSVNGLPGVSWTGRDQTSSSEVSKGTIYWDQSAIYHQRDGSSRAEVLLQAPLDSAANWDRWSAIDAKTPLDTNTTGDPTELDGGLGVDNDNKPADEPTNSSFPTEGSSQFYVADLHSEVISGGITFTECLEIVNVGQSRTINRYWYAPGVGLVKYALNCEFGSDLGTVNGEVHSN